MTDSYRRFKDLDYSNPHKVKFEELEEDSAVLLDEDSELIKFFADCTDSELDYLESLESVTVYDYKDHDYISSYDMTLEPYLSDYVYDQKEFLVFIRLLEIVFSDIKAVINNFNDLTNPDNVVDLFLPKLSYLLDYSYHYDLVDELNRDLIRRLIYLYKRKGTDDDLLNSINFAENPKWVHDKYFLPDAVIDKKTAELEYTINNVFRHDISTHSGNDRYQDSTRFREGVLIIKSKNELNDKLREAIKRVLPAGIKCFYELLTYPTENEYQSSVVDFSDLTLIKNPLISYEIEEDMNIQDRVRSSKFDETLKLYPNRFSGVQTLYLDVEVFS